MSKNEFTVKGVKRSFFGTGPFAVRLRESDITPEEFTAYLNDVFDKSDREAINATMDEHTIQFDYGHIHIIEQNSFDSWREQTGWNPSDA